MKNCLNFKRWLMPLIVIALSLANLEQTKAQVVRVVQSDPRGGGGGSDFFCSNPGSNVFSFYFLMNDNTSVDIKGITIGNGEMGQNKITGELLVSESGANSFSEGEKYGSVWVCTFSTRRKMYNYGSFSTGVDIEVSYTKKSGDGTLTSSIMQEEPVMEMGYSLPINTASLVIPYCNGETWEVPAKPINSLGNSYGRKATEQPNQKTITTLDLYPNPSHNNITIELSKTKESKISIDVLDQLGKMVRNVDVYNDPDTEEIKQEIDLSDLPKGIYYVRVSSENEVLTKKVVKL